MLDDADFAGEYGDPTPDGDRPYFRGLASQPIDTYDFETQTSRIFSGSLILSSLREPCPPRTPAGNYVASLRAADHLCFMD